MEGLGWPPTSNGIFIFSVQSSPSHSLPDPDLALLVVLEEKGGRCVCSCAFAMQSLSETALQADLSRVLILPKVALTKLGLFFRVQTLKTRVRNHVGYDHLYLIAPALTKTHRTSTS